MSVSGQPDKHISPSCFCCKLSLSILNPDLNMFKTDMCPQGHVCYLTVTASKLQATSDCLGKSRPTGLAQADVRNQVPLIITISCNSTAAKKLTWIHSKKNA